MDFYNWKRKLLFWEEVSFGPVVLLGHNIKVSFSFLPKLEVDQGFNGKIVVILKIKLKVVGVTSKNYNSGARV